MTAVTFQRTRAEAILPKRATDGASGYDVCACDSWIIQPGQTLLVDLGLSIQLPPWLTAMVCSRSGLARNNSIFVLNAPGIIDPDYRGSLGAILHNGGSLPFSISAGGRVAQLVFVRHEIVDINEAEIVADTARGAGGYGSTGL